MTLLTQNDGITTMKNILFLLPFLFYSTTSIAKDAHQHGHSAHEKTNSGLHLNNGKKWPTDATLRSNMSDIHNHLKKNLPKIKTNSMSMQDYQKLGKDVQVNIGTIFKSCKLPKEADAQLHIIMVDLIDANRTFSDDSPLKAKRKAFDKTIASYKTYLKFFDATK